MRYKLFGRTGLRVSQLYLGVMPFSDPRESWGTRREDAQQILDRHPQAGANLLDTATGTGGWSPPGTP